MQPSRLVLSFSCAALVLTTVAACVPSPTATPPRETPFPTLVIPTDTPLPTVTFASISTVPPLPSPSPRPTMTIVPATRVPISTTPMTATVKDSISPLLQVFPQSTGPLSLSQPVMLGLLAMDNVGLARFDLYDDRTLYTSEPAPTPAPRTMSTLLTWKPDKVGPHRLRVIAYDVAGNASAPVELTYNVVNDNRPPSASLIEPIGAIDVPVGAPMVVQGSATDDVAVTRVDLYVDFQIYSYLAADQKAGKSPLAVAFMWVPTSAGAHKLFLRAHDNADETGDSAPLIVNAVDSQPPALWTTFERNDVETDGALVIHTLAMSANNLTRVELWADDQMAQVVNSIAPDGQTSLEADLVWPAGIPGDHTLFVRAYDRAGLNSATTPQVVRVLQPGMRAPTSTPVPASPNPTVPVLKQTATPEVILPAAPSITVTTLENPLAAPLPGPIHIRLAAHGSAELDHVELWSYYQGETTPELLYSDILKGSTDKTLEFAWTPPRPGVAFLFARVVDHLEQIGQSPVVIVYLVPPAMPTVTPEFNALAPNWQAVIPTNRFGVSFVQLGKALRGTFINTPLTGSPVSGSINAGTVLRDRVVFSVAFDGADASPRTLDFDCLPSTSPVQLACNYQDEAGNRGSAVFTPTQ